MTDRPTIQIREHPLTSTLPVGRWPGTDGPPHPVSEYWKGRFLSLLWLQLAIKKMMFEYAPLSDGGLSEAFTELYQSNVLVSESTPDMADIAAMQIEFIQGLHREVGLVNRLFVVEAGLKCLIALSGSKPDRSHKLNELYNFLPPEIQTELERYYSMTVKNADAPDSVVVVSSVVGVVALYDALYQELRYPEPNKDESSVVSAWHNLGFLIEAIFSVVTSHPSQSAMSNVSEMSIE